MCVRALLCLCCSLPRGSLPIDNEKYFKIGQCHIVIGIGIGRIGDIAAQSRGRRHVRIYVYVYTKHTVRLLVACTAPFTKYIRHALRCTSEKASQPPSLSLFRPSTLPRVTHLSHSTPAREPRQQSCARAMTGELCQVASCPRFSDTRFKAVPFCTHAFVRGSTSCATAYGPRRHQRTRTAGGRAHGGSEVAWQRSV